MASIPWVLPDDFDPNSVEAWIELTDRLSSLGQLLPPESLRALRAGDIAAFLRLSNVDFVTNEFLPLQAVIQRQATSAASAIYSEAGVDAVLAFDLIDARSVEYAETQVGKLIRQITDEARENIRNIISQSESGKYTYQQAADLIEQGLGLTSRQNQAVDNFYNRNFERFINEGRSETAARLKAKRLTDEYRQKTISRRAQTIARTEIADAAMTGRYIGWEAGVTAGVIDNASVKEWIAEPDACPICLPLDGTIIGWNQDYPIGQEGITGTSNKMPPAHPNCRCVVAILPPDYADSIFTNQANPDTNVDAEAQVEEYRDDSVMADAELVKKHLPGQHDQYRHAGVKSYTSIDDLVKDGLSLNESIEEVYDPNLDKAGNGNVPMKILLERIGKGGKPETVASIDDLDGEPFYRGTTSENADNLVNADYDRIGLGYTGDGYYFTDNPVTAEDYASRSTAGVVATAGWKEDAKVYSFSNGETAIAEIYREAKERQTSAIDELNINRIASEAEDAVFSNFYSSDMDALSTSLILEGYDGISLAIPDGEVYQIVFNRGALQVVSE